jgi:tetratricopeptide (TPR) repeat protein
MIMKSATRCNWKPLDSSIQNNTGAWKPHRYSGQSLFNPNQREEELLLLLQIAEQQAAANVVLERSAEFARARRESLANVIAIHDLFSIAFTPHRHFAMDLFEKAIKFSFENRHVWLQFGLASHQTGRNSTRCICVFEECLRLQPDDPLPLLFQAKIYLQQLADAENALRCAEQALLLVQESTCTSTQHLYSRCHLLIGVGSALLYEQQSELLRPKNVSLLEKSINAFRQMVHCNPHDHLPHFHLALHLCKQKELDQAVAHLQIALTLHPGHLPTIHLLLICLSALQKHQEAHALCESALLEFPGQLLLLFIKAHLETQLSEDGEQQALLTAKELLRCCHRIAFVSKKSTSAPIALSNAFATCNPPTENGSRTLSAQNSSYYLTGVNCDTVSLRLEQTLSEAACIDSAVSFLSGQLVSELSEPNLGSLHHSQSSAAIATSGSAAAAASNVPNPGGSINISLGGNPFVAAIDSKRCINAQLGAMQMQVWLMVAELFIRLNQLGEAEQCLSEHIQTTFGNLSHQLMYVRGRLYLARKQPLEAKLVLQNAISINPRHAPALQQLGLAYHLMGNHQIADKYLRDSLNCDSSCVRTWSIMGDVLEALGDYSRAVNCHLNALKLEETQPVLPFTIVPRLVLD